MHRFYLPPERCGGSVLQLAGREAHHALHVLRLKRGEPVVVLDGMGREFLCEVEKGSRETMELRVIKKIPFRPHPVKSLCSRRCPGGKLSNLSSKNPWSWAHTTSCRCSLNTS